MGKHNGEVRRSKARHLEDLQREKDIQAALELKRQKKKDKQLDLMTDGPLPPPQQPLSHREEKPERKQQKKPPPFYPKGSKLAARLAAKQRGRKTSARSDDAMEVESSISMKQKILESRVARDARKRQGIRKPSHLMKRSLKKLNKKKEMELN